MSVKKRKIFYVSGFDPRGDKFYHRLYKNSAKDFSEKAGEEIEVSKLNKKSEIESEWSIENKTHSTTNSYSFLNWQDIIQKNWEANPIKLAAKGFWSYLKFILFLQWKVIIFDLPRKPILTFIYPFLLPLILLSLIVFTSFSLFSDFHLLAKVMIFIVSGALSVYLLKTIKALWLIRFFIFNNKSFNKENKDLQKRISEFADIIKSECEGGNDYDEVLIIGHSNGTILLVLLLAELGKKFDAKLPENLSVLSLGHCIPLVSYYKKAEMYRRNLKYVAGLDINWLDISYPSDGACYSKVDPFLAVLGEGKLTRKVNLELISPRFFKYYDADKYKKLVRNKYDLHFQYLMSGDKISKYNYFNLTSGGYKLFDVVNNSDEH